MTTVINNPGENNNGNNSSGAAGVLIGAVIVILVLVVVFVLSLPYLRKRLDTMTHPTNPTINVTLPSMPGQMSAPTQTP